MSVPRQLVIVGASLAGLRAAETLREQGYGGRLVIVGDEPHRPYDRPPLSKQVALGGSARTTLPRKREIEADWKLGTAAVSLDMAARRVALANGESVPYDRLLVATGTRARPWPGDVLAGVLTLRTREDAEALRRALQDKPRRVVVIGGGFNGCELASACCALDLPVTLVEHSASPLASALGTVVGAAAAALQRAHGVDLRCGRTVVELRADASGHVRGVELDDGSGVDTDLVVVALGSMPNVEWLDGSGLAAGPRGLACDVGGRAFDCFGMATDDVFAAGDVARFPHPLFNYEFMTLEHWGNAVEMARVAAHNMLAQDGRRRPHLAIPAFWSSQFDVSIKSVGIPPAADTVAIVQGSLDSGAFVALYGREGRLVAAVTFDQGKWLQRYIPEIEAGAAFPGDLGLDPAPATEPVPAAFPHPAHGGLASYITLSGHQPGENRGVRYHAR